MSSFPPTILTSGTRDLLLSNTVGAHRKLRRAGVAPETKEVFTEIAGFKQLGK